jgi:hypothetical protein
MPVEAEAQARGLVLIAKAMPNPAAVMAVGVVDREDGHGASVMTAAITLRCEILSRSSEDGLAVVGLCCARSRRRAMVCAAGSAERTKPRRKCVSRRLAPDCRVTGVVAGLGEDADDRARENVSLGRSTIGSVVLGRVIGVGRSAASPANSRLPDVGNKPSDDRSGARRKQQPAAVEQ